jgi:hypothetical protein
MKGPIALTLTGLSVIFVIGCTSRQDEFFPEFPARTPVIVSTNDAVLVGEVYRPREICRVDSVSVADRMYNYIRSNYNGNWETIVFRHYAPKYHIDFGGTRITVSSGGMTMRVHRSDYLLNQDGKISFYKRVPKLKTFELIRHLCPDANPAGLHESPAVEVEIRNMSGLLISDVSVSGGGQARSIASIESMRTGSVSLVPEADSELELSFSGSSADHVKCGIRIALAPGMNGKVGIDINDDMECQLRGYSTSLF